jgi:hypothetical protein
MIGLGLIGLGNSFRGPPLKERKAESQTMEAASQAHLEKIRAVLRSPEYQALERRAKELSDAADLAAAAGEIARPDALREEWYATIRDRDALRDALEKTWERGNADSAD